MLSRHAFNCNASIIFQQNSHTSFLTSSTINSRAATTQTQHLLVFKPIQFSSQPKSCPAVVLKGLLFSLHTLLAVGRHDTITSYETLSTIAWSQPHKIQRHRNEKNTNASITTWLTSESAITRPRVQQILQTGMRPLCRSRELLPYCVF